MAKLQANYRLDEILLEAPKSRALVEGVSTTDIVSKALQQYLQLEINSDDLKHTVNTLSDRLNTLSDRLLNLETLIANTQNHTSNSFDDKITSVYTDVSKL